MANETQITVLGNLTADPELRFTPNGAAVANFTIASTPRNFDKQANEWRDGETLFLRCSVWRDYAENVVESLTKGTAVIAQGNLVQRSFETKEGDKRTVVELQVTDIGPALRYATAQVTKVTRGQQAGGGGFGDQPSAGFGQQPPVQEENPWGTGAPSGGANPPFAPMRS